MKTNKTKNSVTKVKSNTGKDIGLELRKHHFILGNHGNLKN